MWDFDNPYFSYTGIKLWFPLHFKYIIINQINIYIICFNSIRIKFKNIWYIKTILFMKLIEYIYN